MKILFAVATAVLTATTFAEGPRETPKFNPRMRMMEGPTDPIIRLVNNPKIAEKIGLTEEQRKRIKEIEKSSRSGITDLRKTLRDSMEKQSELLKAEKIDEAAVMAEIDKAFDARKEMAKRQTKRVIDVKSILSPEQVASVLKELEHRPRRKNPPTKADGTQPKPTKPTAPETPASSTPAPVATPAPTTPAA